MKAGFVLIFFVCSLFPSAFAEERRDSLKVVATFSILGDLVTVIAKDRVDLKVLVEADSDGHMYQPTAADALAVRDADILVANGLGFESWLSALKRAAGFDGVSVILGNTIKPLNATDHHDHGFELHDPHVWQDVLNVIIYVEAIAKKLSELDADNAWFYEQNAVNYINELLLLNEEIKAFSMSIPKEQRKIVTSHDAFAYFGAAYGFTFISPQGISTDAEAKAQDVARLIRQIRSENIRALFVENMLDERLLQQVARETNARIGGRLYSDALSGPDGDAPNYLALMRHNLGVLNAALRAP